MATASLSTDSPKTSAYRFTSTRRSLNMARMVSGSVGDIRAPKYKESRNVKLLLKYFGISFTQPYMKPPIRKADKVVPTMANVSMAPKLRKKYFCKSKIYLSKLFSIQLAAQWTYLFQAIARIKDNWWQDNIEKYLRIERCLKIDFVLIHIVYLSSKHVGIRLDSLWRLCAICLINGVLKLKPNCNIFTYIRSGH